jgi:hypothetical protein
VDGLKNIHCQQYNLSTSNTRALVEKCANRIPEEVDKVSDLNHQAIKTSIHAVFNGISQAFANLDIEAALDYFADHEDMLKVSNGLVLRGGEHQKAVVTNIFILEDSRWKILLDHTTYVQ